MDKAYDPQKYEESILKKWNDAKAFLPKTPSESKTGKSYTIPLPPPNVTGTLHLGHAMMLVVEDIMARYHRMKGDATLWVPGTDHAAIATESVVLKNLGVPSREVFTREEFLGKCFDHTKKSQATITNQVKKMGASCDFSRERYTMDLGMSNAVSKIFKDLYEAGLIVRGYRMVNWSWKAQSVLADDELESEDRKETFSYIKCGRFVIGTVRSETKCANSPVVIHPDENYVVAKFVGAENLQSEEFVFSEVLFDDIERRTKVFNLLPEGTWEKVSVHLGSHFEGETFEAETYAGKRKFFVMTDNEVIDINKGTGAMTISVNHAPDDYLLAQKYPEKLKEYYIEKIGFDGKMTNVAGELEGVEVEIARKRAIKIMQEKNLLVGLDKEYSHAVPLCYRTGCVIEPMISPQWFVSVEKEFLWQENVGAIQNSKFKIQNEGKIFLARHGESEGNAQKVFAGGGSPNLSLTEKGQEDAKKLGEQAKQLGITKIISSTLKRAKDTAEIVREVLGLQDVEVWEDIQEMNVGEWEGKPLSSAGETIHERIRLVYENKEGENSKMILERASKFLQKIKNYKSSDNILFIGHTISWSAVFAVATGKNSKEGFYEVRENLNFKNGEVKELHLPPKNHFIFVRHGQSEDGAKNVMQATNSPLTEKGKDHAKTVAEELKGRNITKILASPTTRAWQTAEIIAEQFGIPVEPFEEFSTADTGTITGTPKEQVLPLSPLEYAEKMNTGETYAKFFQRVQKGVEKIISLPKEEGDILVVAHRGVFSAMDTILEGGTLADAKTARRKNENAGHGIWSERYLSLPNPIKTTLKELTLSAVRDSGVTIIPERFNKIYFQWIENLRDWCISRQIWWGHQIPIWYDENGVQHVAHEQTLLFARHGESQDNIANKIGGDSSLTEKGKLQAEELAQKLLSEGRNISKIYSSSLKRAKETAEIVAKIIGEKNLSSLEIEEFPDFHEIFAGRFEGTIKQGTKSSVHTILAEQTGENLEQIEARAKKFWNTVSEFHPSQGEILFIGHETFLSMVFGVKDGRFGETLLDYRDRWSMKNGAVKEVIWMLKPKGENLKQDNDTLDTWFSSALWPFSTLGWPDKTPDFENFYPTAVLETGHDILFFWVARMIMFGRFATGKNPFKDVYLHGLVCDEHGKKMSKSKGNGIDPLEMIDKFGTDALRMSLVVGTTPGNQVNLGEKKIEGFRNFSNKLWNISRYILQLPQVQTQNIERSLSERWILSKLQNLVSEVTEGLENNKYGEVGQKLYDFTWNDLADWAIESAKAEESQTIGHTLHTVLKTLLKLLHPYIPFVTEVIWQEMGNTELLLLQEFPVVQNELIHSTAEELFARLQAVVSSIRSLRSASKVDPTKKITAVLYTKDVFLFQKNEGIIKLLARLEHIEFGEKPNEECVSDIVDGVEIYLPLSGMLDETVEKARKAKELEEAKKQLATLENRLSNEKYIASAPAHLVEETKKQYESIKMKIDLLEG